jgi:hypothetical protein
VRSPYLISYILLILPFIFLGHGILYLNRYYYSESNVTLLWFIVFALCQPVGSLLAAPAANPGRLYRLNPLMCMAESVSTIFTLLKLRFSGSKQLSWVAAAKTLLYQREAVVLTSEQLHGLVGGEKSSYAALRKALGFPPLQIRSLDASASISMIYFFILARICMTTPVGTFGVASLLALSFTTLQGTILIATSRVLDIDEEGAVENEFKAYILAHYLEPSDTPSKRPDVDDGAARFTFFLVIFLAVSSLVGLVLTMFHGMGFIFEHFLPFIGVLLMMEVLCFVMMRARSLGPRRSDLAHLTVGFMIWMAYMLKNLLRL